MASDHGVIYTALQPGDRVRVAEDATWSSFPDENAERCSARGQEAVIVSGPDYSGDFEIRTEDGAVDYAHGSFLALLGAAAHIEEAEDA